MLHPDDRLVRIYYAIIATVVLTAFAVPAIQWLIGGGK